VPSITIEHFPWLVAMALLICGCAFFSASEAALFFLTPHEQRLFAAGRRPQRITAELLRLPDRLLTAALSDVRIEEIMRPRMRYRSSRPPVSLADVEGHVPAGGYVLVTEPHSDEVAAAIPLETLSDLPRVRLERLAEEVVYVPWCATAGGTLDLLLGNWRNRCCAAARLDGRNYRW
jgi:hypothetical protein